MSTRFALAAAALMLGLSVAVLVAWNLARTAMAARAPGHPPSTVLATAGAPDPAEVVITVAKDGSLRVVDKPFTHAQLKERLVDLVRINREQQVRLLVHKDASYAMVVGALDTVTHSGISNIVFAPGNPPPRK
jgi:biopolymer transport protein ExbD